MHLLSPPSRVVPVALLSFSITALWAAPANAEVADPRFAEEVLHRGNGMISIEFGPGDRMYVCEKSGRILVFQPDGSGGYNEPTVFADLSDAVNAPEEAGLLGLALDPSFSSNRHVFAFYTTPNDQRLVRLTANASYDAMEPGSETMILTGLPRDRDYHKAGDIQFHPNDDNAIFVALGDDGAADASQPLDRYEGKILRVDKETGEGLPDNPFYDGSGDSIASRVWARGLRNPYRFAFHPAVPVEDAMYISENGQMVDRLSFILAGSNGNWSMSGGDNALLSPTDENHRVLDSHEPTLTGIAITTGGAFADPDSPQSDVLLLANGLGTITRYRLSGDDLGDATRIDEGGAQAFVFGGSYATGADMTFGPDGALYFTTSGGDEMSRGRLMRIRFAGGSPPMAAFDMMPQPASGEAPLTVSFRDRSSDSDGTIVGRQWDFGDGGESSEQDPTHVYEDAGVFTARLSVTDDTGLRSNSEAEVRVTRSTSVEVDLEVIDATSDQPLTTQLRAYQSDAMTPMAIEGGMGMAGNALEVQQGTLETTLTGEVTSSIIVLSLGEPDSDGVHAAYIGVDIEGEEAQLSRTVYLSGTAIRGRVTDTRERAANVDLGIALEGEPYAVAGGRDYLASSDRDQSGAAHRIVSAGGYYYFPLDRDRTGSFEIDVVADTGADTYTSTEFTASVGSDDLLDTDVTVGLWSGGQQCDDLSGIAETPGVDYDSQIDTIWQRSCNGCHNASPDSNGGLNLETDSRAHLVDQASELVPGLAMVTPGEPGRSFLMEKINCAEPQLGTRMRPTNAMPPSEQALVRDWIAQGAQTGGGSGPTGGTQGGSSSGERDAGSTSASASAGCGCRVSEPGKPVAASVLLGLCLGVLGLRRARRR